MKPPMTIKKDSYHCRYCKGKNFEKRKMPRYKYEPPIKIGLLCLDCGETVVVDYYTFVEKYELKAK
jgi:DNA-directed RNA polymerase subunit RPC12/RpoP